VGLTRIGRVRDSKRPQAAQAPAPGRTDDGGDTQAANKHVSPNMSREDGRCAKEGCRPARSTRPNLRVDVRLADALVQQLPYCSLELGRDLLRLVANVELGQLGYLIVFALRRVRGQSTLRRGGGNVRLVRFVPGEVCAGLGNEWLCGFLSSQPRKKAFG
jgi:hypothetical protein